MLRCAGGLLQGTHVVLLLSQLNGETTWLHATSRGMKCKGSRHVRPSWAGLRRHASAPEPGGP